MPDLPRGTVTFLFTDIEDSTARWEQDRQAMAMVVARHIALLDAAIAAHGGVHFKTVGDAVQAAFPTAPQAVAAAVEGQRALLAEDWGDLGPIRVRMALHAGEALPDARGDYLAAPLNRLSRLLSTGSGGQVLLSQTVQQLTRGALPAEVSLRDLGDHRLRDLLEPEQVFQLVHPDLPADFPPLMSLDARPNNLPRQPTPFLGREGEVRAVIDLLRRADVQLLTLTGPGGSGKTRLALQVAAEVVEAFPDGVFFVPLAAVTDPSLVANAMADALGLREEPGRTLTDQLRSALAGKTVLLVLDNVEHVVEAAPVVGELLAACSGLTVLATSRVPLRLRAEREYPVRPLGLPRRKPPPTAEQLSQYEAVGLFIARAQAVKPDFSVTNETAPAVAEICHRLDGLPLAIELAAPRVRMFAPQAMLARMEARLPMLTGGARDAPARQQTMRAAIAWSHDLLAAEEQRLFCRLAVFPGGCTLEAVEAVMNPEGGFDVYSGIASLVDKSLLRQDDGHDGEPRFTLLETIREFATEQLAASNHGDQAWRAHLDYLLQFVRKHSLDDRTIGGREFEARLVRLTTEEGNLRAALEWALVHDPERALALGTVAVSLWGELGQMQVGFELCQRILAATVESNNPDRVWIVAEAANFALDLGDFDKTEALAETAFALAERQDEPGAAAYARFLQGSAASSRVAWARGEKLLNDARDRYEALDSLWAVGGCLNGLGICALNQGDAAGAAALFKRTLAIAADVDDPRMAALSQVNLAWAQYYLGQDEQAHTASASVAAQAAPLGATKMQAGSRNLLGLLALRRGEPKRAATLIAESLQLRWDFGDKWNIARVLEATAATLVAADHPDKAARVYGTIEALRETIDAPIMVLDTPDYARNRTIALDALGEAAFVQALTAGRRLPLETAVHEALAMLQMLGEESGSSENPSSPAATEQSQWIRDN